MIGLAPAAHGGNRTGRVFTGDKSSEFLFQCLFKAGYLLSWLMCSTGGNGDTIAQRI